MKLKQANWLLFLLEGKYGRIGKVWQMESIQFTSLSEAG